MKKHWLISLFSLFLCTALLLCVFSACGGDKYKMQESTREEKQTILTMGGHEVPYELFRAFFLTRTSALDAALPWEEKWEKVMPDVLEDISRVYAVFSLCEKYDIDPNSDAIDQALKDRIEISVDGGTLNGIYVSGYGKYSAYLDALAANYLTDRASRLILRYQIAEEKLLSALAVPYKSSYQYTEADLQAFYESDNCRALEMVCRDLATYPDLEENYAIVEKALEYLKKDSSDENRQRIYWQYFNNTKLEESKAFVSLHAFPAEHGRDLLDEAFTLEIGEYSEPLTVRTGTSDYIYLLRRIEKPQGNFKDVAEDIEDLYLRDYFYRELSEKEAELRSNVAYTDLYREKENKQISFEKK